MYNILRTNLLMYLDTSTYFTASSIIHETINGIPFRILSEIINPRRSLGEDIFRIIRKYKLTIFLFLPSSFHLNPRLYPPIFSVPFLLNKNRSDKCLKLESPFRATSGCASKFSLNFLHITSF